MFSLYYASFSILSYFVLCFTDYNYFSLGTFWPAACELLFSSLNEKKIKNKKKSHAEDNLCMLHGNLQLKAVASLLVISATAGQFCFSF